jgi:hypothetical protein
VWCVSFDVRRAKHCPRRSSPPAATWRWVEVSSIIRRMTSVVSPYFRLELTVEVELNMVESEGRIPDAVCKGIEMA